MIDSRRLPVASGLASHSGAIPAFPAQGETVSLLHQTGFRP